MCSLLQKQPYWPGAHNPLEYLSEEDNLPATFLFYGTLICTRTRRRFFREFPLEKTSGKFFYYEAAAFRAMCDMRDATTGAMSLVPPFLNANSAKRNMQAVIAELSMTYFASMAYVHADVHEDSASGRRRGVFVHTNRDARECKIITNAIISPRLSEVREAKNKRSALLLATYKIRRSVLIYYIKNQRFEWLKKQMSSTSFTDVDEYLKTKLLHDLYSDFVNSYFDSEGKAYSVELRVWFTIGVLLKVADVVRDLATGKEESECYDKVVDTILRLLDVTSENNDYTKLYAALNDIRVATGAFIHPVDDNDKKSNGQQAESQRQISWERADWKNAITKGLLTDPQKTAEKNLTISALFAENKLDIGVINGLLIDWVFLLKNKLRTMEQNNREVVLVGVSSSGLLLAHLYNLFAGHNGTRRILFYQGITYEAIKPFVISLTDCTPVIIDETIKTGTQMHCATKLVERMGATEVQLACLVNMRFYKERMNQAMVEQAYSNECLSLLQVNCTDGAQVNPEHIAHEEQLTILNCAQAVHESPDVTRVDSSSGDTNQYITDTQLVWRVVTKWVEQIKQPHSGQSHKKLYVWSASVPGKTLAYLLLLCARNQSVAIEMVNNTNVQNLKDNTLFIVDSNMHSGFSVINAAVESRVQLFQQEEYRPAELFDTFYSEAQGSTPQEKVRDCVARYTGADVQFFMLQDALINAPKEA